MCDDDDELLIKFAFIIDSLSTGTISLSSLVAKFSNELSNEATGDGEVALREKKFMKREKLFMKKKFVHLGFNS